MKKILCLIFCLCLSVSLVACGSPASELPPAPAPEEVEITRGTWDGDTFTSDFSAFTFEKPEGWTIATDEEIGEMTQGALSDGSVCDMMVKKEDGCYVNVTYENLVASTGTASTSEETYLSDLTEMYTYYGYEVMSTGEKTIGDETYRSIAFYAENEEHARVNYILCRKKGSFMILINAMVSDGDVGMDILSYFA